MKKKFSISIVSICALFLFCGKTQNDSASLENHKTIAVQDTAKTALEDNATEQENGFTSGTVTQIYFAVEDQGAITLKTEDGTEKIYQYSKSKTQIDSTMLNSKIVIFWSLQVDTTLDEANSFYMVDSVNIPR